MQEQGLESGMSRDTKRYLELTCKIVLQKLIVAFITINRRIDN